MTRRRPVALSPGPLEDYAPRFDDLLRARAQREGFRRYLEGLVLAARAKARLGQSLSAAQHAEGHLQVVGVGDWKPTGTRPAWNAEPQLTEEDS